jgi:iron complex outermembrane receptor protein
LCILIEQTNETFVKNKPTYNILPNSNTSMKTSTRKHALTVLAAQVCFFAHFAAPTLAASEGDNQYLDMDLAQLMQVTITSVSKRPQVLVDTAAAAFVITQEDIRSSGVTSIPEALAMAPGIQVARISSSKWSISSRGFGGYTSNKLLVLIDGRSVYTPAYSGTFWDMQNTLLEDIDRIEVIRGPGGTIWGANAVNGVINIITKKSQDTIGTMVRAGVGDQEKMTMGARYGNTIGSSAYGRFYVTANDRDSNVLASNDQDAQDGWHNVQGGFRMDGMVGSKNEWNLQGDLYKNEGEQIVYPFWLDTSPYRVTNYDDYSANGNNLTGSWKHRLASGDLLSLTAYYDRNDRKESYYEQNFNTLDLNLQYETTLGDRNSLTMGTGFRQVDSASKNTFQVYIPDQTNELYSVFLQDEIKMIADRLWLTLGTKYEHNAYTGNEWQPSARLLFKPAVNHSLWTAVARAVRTPSMIENSGSITVASYPTPLGTQTMSLTSNPDFGSESLIAYEAGYRWQARKDLSLDVAVYYNDYDDIYYTLPSTDPTNPDLLLTNGKEGNGQGVEAAVNWKTNAWLSLIFTYTWQEIELNEKNSATSTSWGLGEDFTTTTSPRHQASIRSAIDLAENWQLNCWLRYVDNIKGRNTVDPTTLVPVDSYFLLDSNLIWKPKQDLEIMLAVQNLLNSSQLEYVSELITPPTEIERGVYGKVTWHF